jgi:hypothetical protein
MFMRLIFVFLVLAIAAMACGLPTNFQSANTPGPITTDQISVNAPDGDANLLLTFGAGKLTLAPGAQKLIEGVAKYNVPDFKPEVKETGADISITQGNYQMNGFPVLTNIENVWDLKLGASPLALVINAGAYEGHFDFGGLKLTALTINDGAAQVSADFSAVNPEKMSALTYKTGASNVTLKNLANANFTTLIFESGAGNYTLDFGGKLQRDCSATVRSGMSNLSLVIPAGIAASVKVSSGLSNVQFPSGWSQHGDTYTQQGTGPALVITIEMGAGNVNITE